MYTSYYTYEELVDLGFQSVGSHVLISRKVSLYGAQRMKIGDNVRIDDFCILSGEIILGSNIHIGAYSALYGSLGIELENNTGISPRCTLFSAMDDFGGDFMIGPIHPAEYTNVTGGRILLKQYSQIGANCIVFPNVVFEEGSVVGAMSLINKSLPSWTISAGIPAQVIRKRSNKLLKLK
ncbi:acyltransferase [Bacteroides xylanisolvens]|uniref:acyltransferase n=1 Tax=Bacteroides xylanisolvens TaxID=371601 RepID=UPI00374E91DE